MVSYTRRLPTRSHTDLNPLAKQASTPTPSTATPPSTLWKEYKNQDGRAYWFHTVDKKSVWEKPEELKTPRERAIASTKWKEYTSGDRKYYVHSETKETTWSVPGELRGEPCAWAF